MWLLFSAPLVQREVARLAVTEGLFFAVFSHEYNPSVSFADSSPYTGEPIAAAGLLNGKSLY